MPHRSTIYARKIREELIAKLGGKCALCPCDDVTQLEFDHKHGSVFVLRMLSYSARMAMYKREYEAGELRLLCKPCNKSERKRNGGHFIPTAHQGVPVCRVPF